MGFGSGNFVFLRPCQDGGENKKGRPGSREKEIGFEIPDFPKPRAPALRFGSMNPISRVLGHGSMGESYNGPNPALYMGKSYNPGGSDCRNGI